MWYQAQKSLSECSCLFGRPWRIVNNIVTKFEKTGTVQNNWKGGVKNKLGTVEVRHGTETRQESPKFTATFQDLSWNVAVNLLLGALLSVGALLSCFKILINVFLSHVELRQSKFIFYASFPVILYGPSFFKLCDVIYSPPWSSKQA